MASYTYNPVASINQGIFNNPRQKTWAVMHKGSTNWTIQLITNSLDEAKAKVRSLINSGGMYMSIDRVMIVEIVPIDTAITPSV